MNPLAMAVVAGILTSPQAHRRISWDPALLSKGLIGIAGLESSWGRNQDHEPNSHGEFHSAFGPLGLMASTAYTEYNRQPSLRKRYPGMYSRSEFFARFVSDAKFYYACANAHWWWLTHFAGSVERAVYGWRFGLNAANEASHEVVSANRYVMQYAAFNSVALK